MKTFVVRTLSVLTLSGLTGTSLFAQSLYFPPNGSSNWDTIAPASLGWCSDRIDSLNHYLESNQSKAFVLLKDGKIVVESYYNNHDAADSWYWASAGKTLTAFMVGQAQQQGFLSIHESTSNYLGEGWTSCTAEQEQAITVRNQLTMTTGLDDGVSNDDCTLNSCLEYLADTSSRWAYHNAPYTLLDSVMQLATGMSLNAWCFQEVAQPIGMQGLWLNLEYNNVYFSNARSMARFGLLLLAEGVWDGNDLLSDDQYFYAMTHTSQPINEGYGYLTWINNTESFMFPETQIVFPGNFAPDAPMDMIAAIGRDGQYICVVPSQQLVWIRMGENPEQLDVPILMINEIWQYIHALPCAPMGTEHSSSAVAKVFPNPANESWNVQCNELVKEWYLLDAMGRELTQNHASVVNQFVIDASDYSNGSYLLKLLHANGRISFQQLFKQ